MKDAAPFLRGKTYCDGVVIPGATLFDRQLGFMRVYKFRDTVHGTGAPVWLTPVKNSTGAAITVARKFFSYEIDTALDFGKYCGAFPNTTAGGKVLAIDDAYTVGQSIPDNDIFWAVVQGPVYVLAASSVTNLTAGGAVTSTATGVIANKTTAAAGEYVYGTLDYAASYTAFAETLVWANASLVMPPAA